MNNRDFTAPYVFQEYPKWVTLADGSQMVAQNSDEESILIGPEQPVDERDKLYAEAVELGLKPHHKAGADKLRQMIADARSE